MTDEDDIIIQPLTHASYAGRTLKKGVQYQPPPQALDPYELDLKSLEDIFDNSDRDLVSTLGGKANLGGTHANAVCELAGVKPNSETKDVSSEKILSALQSLLDDLANSREGYLMLKSSEEFDEKALEEHILTLQDNSIRDRFLEKHANEATPTLLPSHSNLVKMNSIVYKGCRRLERHMTLVLWLEGKQKN